jgi:Reverse transcriptase (RNA-dependent DNA polymerase)
VNGVKHARLVTRGFQQITGQDYDPDGGRYAPVVSLIVFKLCCAVMLTMWMFAHIVDVHGAFLSGDLSGNPVYISVPQGMEAVVQQSLNDSAARASNVPLLYKNVALKLVKSL